MRLLLDAGNSMINALVIENYHKIAAFNIKSNISEIADSLLERLLTNDINPLDIDEVAITSVVLELNSVLEEISKDIFNISPFFLNSEDEYNLKIDYEDIDKLGSDRLAVSIAAAAMYPKRNVLVVDLGTATTFELINKEAIYLGGAIAPGIRISTEALNNYTSQLPIVKVDSKTDACGKTTQSCIQSGIYYGHLGMIKEIISQYKKELNEELIVIATGGFASLFSERSVFSAIIDDLVLQGLSIAYDIKKTEEK